MQERLGVGQPQQLKMLAGFENLVPGTAKMLIDLAESESTHRRNLELIATQANIDTQKKQLEIANNQIKVNFKSDTLGHSSGVIVSLACIAGSVWLALNSHDWVAAALAAIPTAAVVKAFFSHRPPIK